MLCLKTGTKDLDTQSGFGRGMPQVCLHNPKDHEWWESRGLVEKFPLAAGAEIIGPRFSWRFGIHISSQVLIFMTLLTDSACMSRFVWPSDKFWHLSSWGIMTHIRSGDPFPPRSYTWWCFQIWVKGVHFLYSVGSVCDEKQVLNVNMFLYYFGTSCVML